MDSPATDAQLPTPRQILSVASTLYLRPLASILLVGSAWVGAGMWILLLQEPRLAMAAFLALTIVEVISQVMARGDATVFGPMTRANALLCSLAAAFLLAPMQLPFLLEMPLILGALCAGLYFTLIFNRLLRNTTLPAVIWPYSLLAAMSAMLLPFGVYDSAVHFDWPVIEVARIADLPDAFVHTMGGLVFSPSLLSGVLISALVFAWSPAMFVAGMVGWLTGALTSMALVTVGLDPHWPPASYNFFLSGMALGAVFFLPGLRGMAIAVFAGMIAALFAALLKIYAGPSGISYLPVPFGLTLFSGLLAFDNPAFSPGLRRNLVWFEPPEDAWIKDAWTRMRWGALGELLAVPLVGPVEVVQGFDSGPTHRGAWRHALDFQRPCLSALERRDRPSLWAEPVYSPVIGEVVHMRNDVADNPPGVANYGDNWGNHVMLRTGAGNHVLLAHFMQGSVAVVPGQRVSFASYLGTVGNSGRSTTPHLHLQVQADSALGAPTKPFSLANFHAFSGEDRAVRTWRAAGRPSEGEVIAAARTNPAVCQMLTSLGPGRLIFAVTARGDVPEDVSSTGPIIVERGLSEAGTLVISSNEKAEVEFRMDIDAIRVIRITGASGTMMAMSMIAVPSIPFCAQVGLQWTDVLPLTDLRTLQYVRKMLSPFDNHAFVTVACECRAVPDAKSAAFTIHTRPLQRQPGLPISCTMTLLPLRGPVRIEAEYPTGGVIYEATSFEPRRM